MSIFSFPTTEIIFWGAGKKCRELVRPALGYDSGENNFDFLSQDEYLAFANNRARPIASYIHQLITKMEADDAYYYDTADTSHILVRQNVYAIKWYFASLEHYYQYAAPAFERLCDQIVPTSFAMPSIDSGPYDIIKDEIVRINNIYPFEGTVSSETYAKSLNKNTNTSTKDDDTSEESGFEENSKLSKPGNPYPELNDRTKKEMEKIKRRRKSSAMGNFSAWPSAAGKAGNFLSSSFQNLLLPKKERSGPMKPPSGNHFQQMKSELTAKRLATIMKSITQRNPSSADFRFLNP